LSAAPVTQDAAPNLSGLDDEALVAAYRAGADAAFAELVRRHQIPIFRLLLGLAADADEAELLCEQVFFDSARRVDERKLGQTVAAWLLSLAREVARNAEAKRGKPAPPKRSPQKPRDPQALVKQEVKSALHGLTGDERVALMLADLEGDSFESIAETLGKTATEAEEIVGTARLKFEQGLAHVGERVEAAGSPSANDELPAGTVLDERFRIETPLGKGGMGTVYRAVDLTTGTSVALKTLLPASAKDPAVRRRFMREAEIIERVHHPNFVGLVKYGERSGEPSYVAMELVSGDALNVVLEKETRLAPQRALHITQHLLAGLKHAHSLGVIHRDVKPENVMLVLQQADPDFAKLLDLGIAKLVAPEDAKKTRLTQKGEVIGTPQYISPEALRGEELDGRADLYSLSVMLYEMLTSRPPFESSNTMGIFAMHLATPPPPLSQAAPGLALPAVLEQLLQQGLAKEPASRIPSAESYEQRIAELLKLDWARLPAAPLPGPARPARARSGISAAQQQQTSPGAPIADGRLRAAWRFVIRSRSTLVTVVLVVAGAIGLLYWVARDLVLGG